MEEHDELDDEDVLAAGVAAAGADATGAGVAGAGVAGAAAEAAGATGRGATGTMMGPVSALELASEPMTTPKASIAMVATAEARPRPAHGFPAPAWRAATPGPAPLTLLVPPWSSHQGVTLHRTRLACLGAALVAVASVATGPTASAMAATLTGAGSTLVAPLEADWNTGWQMTTCNQCVQIPWALSATAVGFHLNGISTLKLSGNLLAEIYLGQITNWDNAHIKALNKGVKLPNRKISVIFRSDGSGDTYAFGGFLSSVSHTWASRLGTGTTVSFPVGVGGKGNGGVTALLSNTNGAIAYLAASYLLQFGGLGAVAVENAAGNFEYPNLKNIANAAAAVNFIPASNAMSIVNPPKTAKIAYPISTFTYVIVPRATTKKDLIMSWIDYALGAGQLFGAKLDFPSIPPIVLSRDESTLASLT
ncbi:MAG TPA: phosphate ABC transporter substrate-binding protein PstS [Solirubrobacteraceae bacterium]|nr:phosphate ABC transporter substrate-binding protein PstS [Solirubrobacteraceae bacterium]